MIGQTLRPESEDTFQGISHVAKYQTIAMPLHHMSGSNPMHSNAFLPFHNFTLSELQFYILFIPVVSSFLFHFLLFSPSIAPDTQGYKATDLQQLFSFPIPQGEFF